MQTYKLTYGGRSDDLLMEDLNIYCKADWASNVDRKLVSGYVVVIAGGAVAWSSKEQATVALSTSEAEYIAATHATKQVIWHHSLLREFDFPIPTTLTIFSDNQAAISIVHHHKFHVQTKHIDIAHHFLRDHIENGILNTVYISTDKNVADIFTKGLAGTKHHDFTYMIGVISEQGGVLE